MSQRAGDIGSILMSEGIEGYNRRLEENKRLLENKNLGNDKKVNKYISIGVFVVLFVGISVIIFKYFK